MPGVSSSAPSGILAVSRPMVKALFVSSCLLSVVSWYTTQQGMALYLSTWFAFLASLGVQSALLLVAWLIGFSKAKRALLIAVYIITAAVSIAFSYGSLYTWFSARERPAQIERKLYDSLSNAAGQTQELLAAAIGEGQKHVLALEEMTGAEKSHGYISRAQDADPYLARIREAVAREAQTYNPAYQEGVGAGLRYTAFDRYAKLARQSVERMQQSQRALTELVSSLKPLDPTETQLRRFREVFDTVPWADVKEASHSVKLQIPAIPAYSEYVDRTATGQEDLLVAFSELMTTPGNRHYFAFALATFIDLIVFLLAYASAPYFFGAPEGRWFTAAAALDSNNEQVFIRNLLRKMTPSAQEGARVDASDLSPGEQQLCLLLASKGLAAPLEEEGRTYYLLDQAIHEQMVESLANPGISLRAAVQKPVSGL